MVGAKAREEVDARSKWPVKMGINWRHMRNMETVPFPLHTPEILLSLQFFGHIATTQTRPADAIMEIDLT